MNILNNNRNPLSVSVFLYNKGQSVNILGKGHQMILLHTLGNIQRRSTCGPQQRNLNI